MRTIIIPPFSATANDNQSCACPACERAPRAPGRDYCETCDADVAAHLDAGEYHPPEYADPCFTGSPETRARWGED